MFLLIVGSMTLNGFVEPPSFRKFDTMEECTAAGNLEVATRPGSWTFNDKVYPFLQFRCEKQG